MPEIEVTFFTHQVPVFDCPARNVVYAKGRRAGGTLGAVNRLVELAHQDPCGRHLWVDTVQRNITRVVERYFAPLLQGTSYHWSATTRCLRFANGARCDFGSAERPELLEGWGYEHIWVNEAGHVLRDESIYYNTLLPMVLEAKQPQLFFIGAPKGPGLFQRMFDWGADPKQTDWRSFRHPSHVNPQLNQQELERLRQEMPEREYRQEILAEFVTGEGAVFRAVQEIATAQAESAPQPGVAYVMGVDLARSGNHTVAWVGRADKQAAVYCERFRGVGWRVQIARLAKLARHFQAAPVYIDATGVGSPICEELRLAGVAVEPIVLTASRKRDLIDALAVAIEQQRLSMIPHQATLRELVAYEQTPLPSGGLRTAAPPGEHDDCVVALALCNWGLSTRNGEWIFGSPTVTSEFVD